jgi:hypothetical protein
LPPEPSPDGPRDNSLSTLSVEQAAALAELCLRWLADRGTDADYDGAGVLHAADGTQYGLFNLAVAVREQAWRYWPAVVAHHLDAVVAANVSGSAPTLDEMLVKVRRAKDLPELPDYDADSPYPGLLALLAQDTPTMVHELLRADDIAHLGALEAVRARAMANLRALPPPDHVVTPADPERSDADLHVFTGSDFFVASRALALHELLADVLSVEAPEHGCVVAVPNRHLLVVHLVAGVGIITAVNAMAALAAGAFAEMAGGVSDEVYYLPPSGPAQSVVARADDGSASVQVEGALAEAFRRLGLIG